ncbi:MAG: Eco57I restriction-modification methylase domain-containing protein [Blastocatellia bacterium]
MRATAIQPQQLKPQEQEGPSAFAERLGRSYAALTQSEHKRSLGQYFTPSDVASFMAKMYRGGEQRLRVLDPGAGAGILSSALCESLASRTEKPGEIAIDAYETDVALAGYLERSLAYAKEWLQVKGVNFHFRIHTDDFVLNNAGILSDSLSLFPAPALHSGKFDLVLANPPYFKLPKSDPRAQAAAAIVWGQPNIYAIFMAISAQMLREGGEMIVISPRSYAAGNYFQLFRERFFARMRPEGIHLFDSRREAFSRDEVLQENLILRARRMSNWVNNSKIEVEVSRSSGIQDLPQSRKRLVPLAEVLDVSSADKVLRVPLVDKDDEIVRIVRSWPGSLHSYGLEISTGPVVPFRAVPLICQQGNVPQTHAPLLWMQNVTAMQVDWPVTARNKSQYIVANEESRPLLVKNQNYVLLRRFSAKEAARRLIAAPFLADIINSPFVGLENHLNYVHRPGGSLSTEEACGLAALLNSSLIDSYFRTFNGNTQVSATELRAMPLPPLDLIKALGAYVMTNHHDLSLLDVLVDELLVNGREEGNDED